MAYEEDRGSRRAVGRPRSWDDSLAHNAIKSLDRAMEVLEYLSENQGKTLTMLAGEMGQSTATIYRILVTLQRRGIADFDAQDQVWHVGPRAFVIGARFLRRTSLVERARPIMRKLMEVTGETANLGVEKEGQVLFLSQVETHAAIRAFFPPGTISAMHASGIGKALLAQMDERRLRRILTSEQLAAFTPNTVTARSALIAQLARIRIDGYAVDDEERNEGMRCIAVPVFDINNEAVAGISVSGPTNRLSDAAIDRLRQPVMAAAQELTAAIGGTVMQPPA